jgi:uncharacterized protein (UPF0332 family)
MESLFARALQAARSAHGLASDGDFDAACNRAYYAMFFAVRALHAAEGENELGKTHASVLRTFSQDYVLTGKAPRELGRALALGQALRAKADYSDAGASRDDAERALAAMDELLAFARSRIDREDPRP